MGTMNKLTLGAALAAVGALAVPTVGHADAATFNAPWPAHHTGGDSGNQTSGNDATGEGQIVRLQAGAPNGSLGCNAAGGYYEFEQPISAEGVETITLSYSDALVGPFGFLKASVRQDGAGLEATVIRGPLNGAGTIVVELDDAVSGPIEVWFGAEVSGACLPSPPFEIAKATFTSLSIA